MPVPMPSLPVPSRAPMALAWRMARVAVGLDWLPRLEAASSDESMMLDEAYELQGEKGSATQVMRTTSGAPGNRTAGGQQAGSPTGEIADVTKPLTPGDYVMLCPIDGKDGPHYKLGQLAEFAIE